MNPIIIAAVVAPLLFAVINFLDRFMVTRVSTSRSAWIFSGFFSFLMSVTALIVVSVIGESILLSRTDALLLLATGFLQISWLYFYFKAFETEDVSTVVPYMQFIGVFSYILGLIFLQENLALPKLLGLVGVILGGGILSYEGKLSFKKGAYYMLFSMLIISLGVVFFKKFTLGVESFTTIGISEFFTSIFWVFLGMGLTSAIVYLTSKSFRNDFKVLIRTNEKQAWKIMAWIELLNIVAIVLVSYASLKIEVAKVSAFESIQLIYVLIIAVVGTKLFPKYISEKIDKKTLLRKIIALVLMLAGGVLLI